MDQQPGRDRRGGGGGGRGGRRRKEKRGKRRKRRKEEEGGGKRTEKERDNVKESVIFIYFHLAEEQMVRGCFDSMVKEREREREREKYILISRRGL